MHADMRAETLILTLFKGIRSNNSQCINVFGCYIRDFSSGFGLFAGSSFDAVGIGQDEQHEDGGDSQSEQSIRLTDKEHHNGYTDQCEDASQQVNNAVIDQLFNVGDIAGYALHKVAFFLPVMPIQREALQVVKHLLA